MYAGIPGYVSYTSFPMSIYFMFHYLTKLVYLIFNDYVQFLVEKPSVQKIPPHSMVDTVSGYEGVSFRPGSSYMFGERERERENWVIPKWT